VDTIAFGVGVRKVSWPDGYNFQSAPTSEASGLVESMEFVVSQPRRGELEHIHKEVIKFDSAWFESLIRMPVDHPYRRMDRVKMAREELGDLLELPQA